MDQTELFKSFQYVGCIIVFDNSIDMIKESLEVSSGEFLSFLSKTNVYTFIWTANHQNKKMYDITSLPIFKMVNRDVVRKRSNACSATNREPFTINNILGTTSIGHEYIEFSDEQKIPTTTTAKRYTTATAKGNKFFVHPESTKLTSLDRKRKYDSIADAFEKYDASSQRKNNFKAADELSMQVVGEINGHIDNYKSITVIRKQLRHNPYMLSLPMLLLDNNPKSITYGGFDIKINIDTFKSRDSNYYDFAAIHREMAHRLNDWYCIKQQRDREDNDNY